MRRPVGTIAEAGAPARSARRSPRARFPRSSDAAAAIARAVDHRRLARGDPRFAHVTDAALCERIVGMPAHPRPARGGWWLVGRIVDGAAEREFLVWLHPATNRVRTGERRSPSPEASSPPPRPDGRIYDGARRRWTAPAEDDPTRQTVRSSGG